MQTSTPFYEQKLDPIKEGDIILNFFDSEFIYKITYKNSLYELSKVKKKWRYDLDWSSLNYKLTESFKTIEEFAKKYLKTKQWFLKNAPFTPNVAGNDTNQLLKNFVIKFFNQLRKKHDFTFEEYEKLNLWDNYFYSQKSINFDEYKQYCYNCKKKVPYSSRYPKYICEECSSKKIVDEEGFELSFSNIDISGGLRIIFMKDGKKIKEDTMQIKKLCFIDGKRFIATEARFGGIVIQAEE